MSNIGHKAILASAGSGKTFQLAHRYIRLLADGGDEPIAPDRICAMTFTRKAAGEIFDSIAEYLRIAATDPVMAEITGRERIGLPGLTQADFQKLLRRFIDDLHRARIGTLDSFIVGIARAFPLELGIPLDFQVTEAGSSIARENRQAILSRILDPARESAIGREFLNAFKNATYGHEEKAFGRLLEQFLDDLRIYYQLCPDGSRWGAEDRIWPAGRPHKSPLKVDAAGILARVTEWADVQPQTAVAARKFYTALKAITAALAVYTPASAWDVSFEGTVFGRLLDNVEAMRTGPIDISYSGKTSIFTLPADITKPLAALIHNLLVIEFDRVVQRTVGLHGLLSAYERTYEDMTRATGSFSFMDVQYLLTGAAAVGGGCLISRQPHGKETTGDRLYIDYRMDCRLDHWLLDEFQDTSDLQWEVFENLVSEIVQAPAEDKRSFFYVGDVKQAIYRWRGGNHELFLKIRDRFNQQGEVIKLEPMQETRRCSQPVIDVINTVFSPLPEALPAAAAAAWQEVWEPHKTAVSNKELGYVALLEPPGTLPLAEAGAARNRLVADLLNEMQPVRRGLEVGILVRNNAAGRKLVDVLRKECRGMSFVHEGDAAITENEITQVLLGLLRLAAHPGDEFTWKYIQMTPMAALLEQQGIHRDDIARELLRKVEDSGFQAFVRSWGEQLASVVHVGAYGRECMERLESAAAEFDATGGTSCNGFIHFIESYTVREQPSSSAVRVMTIHQAKGLEFDVVILPQLQGGSGGNMTKASATNLICAGEKSNPDWLLKMPRRILAEHDPRLREQLEKNDEKHCFDALCTLYVAMTRAKRGLYLVTTRYKKPSALHASVFLKEQLLGDPNPEKEPDLTLNGNPYVCLFEQGSGASWYEAGWPEKSVAEQAIVDHVLPNGYAGRQERSPLLRHREPSKQKSVSRNAVDLFDRENADIMEFGSAIHELLERVAWIETCDIDAIVQEWEPTSTYGDAVTRDVIEQFRKCMAAATVQSSLAHPPGNVELWREKRFEVVMESELVSGAFDRVVIHRDKEGQPVRAEIMDFKSSMVDADDEMGLARKVADYRSQMQAYRDALSKILGLRKEQIALHLLFTRAATVREL